MIYFKISPFALGLPCALPFVGSIQAGFPSPADDHLQEVLDLTELVVQNPNATYYARAIGKSMVNDGVEDGDILVIDRSIEPRNGAMVIGILSGEFTLKRIKFDSATVSLIPANADYPVLRVSEEHDFRVWGIVTYILKKVICTPL
ncbi:MAG: translesion error-prone DNA polymerase V autoproteolytic subunit [Bacteroidetes bacterium]|nr:translesion error-prone DNA polymerase V autoproteolytic subunit [Bacteroidota bacterium]